ncbi:hypothetical protein PTSG_02309 [Salpingoeca rosetta]|uniref:PCI domain-containing protein n=1 Tax=Salpingoeca rosetta (strain ATCC 50818 / BSB-021) TaxID=946362 RepID=F2U1U2_SALR5|nr:uncharacterized protein PTSG_02309 [Salpingoeca rosetta]EGD81594.1 hypothetical protein PTSG_02309 [Salpingoeca rosetta]|eukprot:XP_004996798.1 hypothetical protein PTSG_02309 [Salpingoeca rosetta]
MDAGSAVTGFLKAVNRACATEDGPALARLLSLRDGHVPHVYRGVPAVNVEALASSLIKAERPVAAVAAAHLRAASKLMTGNMEDAFNHQCTCCDKLAAYISEVEEGNWQLKALNIVMFELRQLAKLVDEMLAGQDQQVEAISKATRLFQDCFRAVGNDRRADIARSKKVGMMFIANHMFNLAFRDNNFAYVNTIIRTMNSNKRIEHYQPMCHRVTFYYYMGRKALLDAAYGEARTYFEKALQHCHKDSTRNLRLILLNLIPVNMLLGRMPTLELLQEHDLLQFHALTQALKVGDLPSLDKELETHQEFFTKWNVFLVLQKLQLLAYRNLFKRVHALQQGKTQIHLRVFHQALQCIGMEDVDMDETECIMANLIHHLYVRGYISFQKKIVVFSAELPFPPVGSRV